ncbi:uncharacterized protein LOC127279128 isoform X4 [Leptopilina boulardi]|uniref:uncharacterized protein LOC127279128 isoform X4 n=1 Tax=Leptopilina boulardi TaxID=63433 RepID=UPI0021F5AFF6|nr:uncharacterized protein LOC127279128 isoform X4 [Leptopilina boulardi]
MEMDKNYFFKYFYFNKILLHCCGVLPIETWGSIINTITIILPFCSTSFLVLPVFYTFFFRNLNFETAMTIFSLLVQGIAAAFKALLLLSKRKRLRNLVFLCNSIWKSIKNDEEEAQVVKHYATRGLYFTYGFSLIVFTALVNVILQSAFDEFVIDSNGTIITSRTLPYPSGLFHENIQIFNIWYILQIPAGIFIVILIVGIDTAVVVFVLHACAYFNVLQFRLEKFKELCDKDQQNINESNKIFQEIVTIVKFHQSILHFTASVEHVVNPVVLLQTVLSITAICIFGINCLRTKIFCIRFYMWGAVFCNFSCFAGHQAVSRLKVTKLV